MQQPRPLEPNFQLNFPSCIYNFGMSITGPASFITSVREGREVIVDSRMQLLDDGTVLEVNRDITERKQLEAAIRESDPRMRFLASTVENSDDAIVSKDLNGIILSWNKGAERIFASL